MRIYKNGSVVFTSIDNTGSTDEASLGARYAKGRLDSTWNNLTQNYYTKDQVTTLIEQALNNANLLKAMVVPTVPATSAASSNIIYLVPVTGSDNVYQQYKKVLVSQDPDEYTMALLGSTEVELEDIQVAALPTPTAEQANKVLQYIGEATTQTRGRFYWCAPKNYYAWDLSTDATQTFYVENNPPRPGDNIFTGRTVSGEFIVTVVSQVATVPDSTHMTGTNGMSMLRNTMKDVVGYSWIALFSKLSEFENDGDGTSPFVTQDDIQLVATVGTTTSLEIREAIANKREILIDNGADQPYHAVIYAEDKGADGAYIISADITKDTDRWDRLRPTFHAYTVLGSVWTAAEPLGAVVEDDLANILTALPSVGVPNTRYLLKVTDTSTVGYHLDEYIYTDGKWVYISKAIPAPFIATINETSQAEIKAAIDAGSPIYVYSDITGVLRPAITASATTFTASIQYLSLSGTSGNYTLDLTSCSVTGTTWTPTQIGIALKTDLENYYTKSEVDLDIDQIYEQFAARKKSLHLLVRYNNDAKQYPMGWIAIVTANTTETYASFAKWLYNKNYRSIETSYPFVGGCLGTTGVASTSGGTAYVGRVGSGAYSADGTTVTFKWDYNGTTNAAAARCSVISFPLS